MRYAWVILVTIVAASCASGGETPLVSSSTGVTGDGKPLVVLESNLYRLSFEPERGGRCTSFVVKKRGRELGYPDVSPGAGYPGSEGGFFLDYFAEEPAPGEFIGSPYEHEIVGAKEGEVSLRLWRLATGKVGEKDFPSTSGILLEKVITIYANSPAIEVSVSLTNTTQEPKSGTLHISCGFQLGGQKEEDIYYRPSSRYIQVMHENPSVTGVVPEEWVRDPVEGWSAGRDDKTDEGILFLMDYNDLATLYNGGANTADWYMDRVALSPGQKWSTRYSIIPVDGFKGFVYASDRLVADIEISPEKDKVKIQHFVAGSRAPIGPFKIRTSIIGVRSSDTRDLPEVSLEGAGLSPATVTIEAPGAQTEPIIVRAEVVGVDWKETYETYFWGEFAPFLLPGYPMVPERTREKPPKKKAFLSEASWNFPENNQLDVLLFFGLYTQWYGIEKAVEGMGPHSIKVSNAVVGIHYQGADYVPASNEEIMGYDVVILSDVNFGSLKNFGMDIVAEYVRQGGGLLVLGGPFAYGEGDYVGTVTESVLPVGNMRDFDLVWEKEGLEITPGGTHEILDGKDDLVGVLRRVDFTASPKVYWFHDLRPKNTYEVILKAGEKPLLIVARIGKGKVAAFLGSPLGEGREGEVPFWKWAGWEKLMQNTIRWLAERE